MFVWYVETRGKSLEGVDEVFETRAHTGEGTVNVYERFLSM